MEASLANFKKSGAWERRLTIKMVTGALSTCTDPRAMPKILSAALGRQTDHFETQN